MNLRRIRRFRFNRPQRIAAGLLALFLLQGLWLIGRQSLTARDYQYARCGRELWERPAQLQGSLTSCGLIRDGILAYRLAGLPLTLNLLTERALDPFRSPENRIAQTDGQLSSWELRHQLTYTLFLLRLPFLAAGCLLGAGLWWVTRRLYGNLGGYTALALYCFSPAILKASLSPNPEILASLGLYGGVYTAIGVAHAMPGPRNPGPPATGLRRWGGKWLPRILLLTFAFTLAAAAHLAALAIAALLGLAIMLWIAEGRRLLLPPVLCATVAGALLLLFAGYSFSPNAFASIHSLSFSLTLDPARRFFSAPANAGMTIAAIAALVLYLCSARSRYFGNSVPLLCATILVALTMTSVPAAPWLWALPFLFTFIAGAFADAYESPKGRLAMGVAAALILLQAVLCVLSLPRLL